MYANTPDPKKLATRKINFIISLIFKNSQCLTFFAQQLLVIEINTSFKQSLQSFNRSN